jgi:hypothetical protein
MTDLLDELLDEPIGEFAILDAEEQARLTRFFLAKSRKAPRSRGRLIGCLCCQPHGRLRRTAAHRYLPLKRDPLFGDPRDWMVYDRTEQRFLKTWEVMALPEEALMTERVRLN